MLKQGRVTAMGPFSANQIRLGILGVLGMSVRILWFMWEQGGDLTLQLVGLFGLLLVLTLLYNLTYFYVFSV